MIFRTLFAFQFTGVGAQRGPPLGMLAALGGFCGVVVAWVLQVGGHLEESGYNS